MVLVQTRLAVADNSGATGAYCIKIIGKENQVGAVGDLIIVSIKTAKPKKKVRKGEVRQAVIIRQRNFIRRPEGIQLRFDENAVVLVNKQGNPLGSRVRGPLAQELRRRKYMKLITMASSIV